MNRNDELTRAREQMRQAEPKKPEPYQEETDMSENSTPMAPMTPNMPTQENNTTMTGGAMTIMDFMDLANSSKFVDKLWKSKGKTVQIRKFTKGDLDKISAPLLRKTMKLDLNTAGKKDQQMNLDISMDIFGEMEKIMVEIGLSSYKDSRGACVINRTYIDDVMTDEDFKELVELVKEVNPKAMIATAEANEEIAEAKK